MVAGAKDTVGLAMVGSGFAARFHAENYRRVYGVGVRFVGVYSRRPEAAAEFAQELGFERSYASMEELLADPDVDLVDTCIPTASTRRWQSSLSRLTNMSWWKNPSPAPSSRGGTRRTGGGVSTRPWPAPTG